MDRKNNKVKENIQKLLLRLELWFAPVLISVPFAVSLIFLSDWYVRGYSVGSSAFDGEMFLGILILIGNMMVDIQFLRSIRGLRKSH